MNATAEKLGHKVDTHVLEKVAEALKLKVELRDAENLRLKEIVQRQDAVILEQKRMLEAKEQTIERFRKRYADVTKPHEEDRPTQEPQRASA